MRPPRSSFLLLPGLIAALAAAHCGGGDDKQPPPPAADSGTDAVADAEQETSETDTAVVGDAQPDAPAPVTCTKSPAFQPPVRVNHNPDALRRVANAGMVQLDDGRLMIALLEALDTGSRYALWVRTFDPATSAVSPDERLDVDADGLTDTSGFQIFHIPGGAIAVRYGDTHVRVRAKGKWSPDLAATMAIAAGDELGWIAAPSGQVLVTRARTSAPYGQAVVYRPDEGGVRGSWTAPQSLDLDGATGKPRIDRATLADGRFLTLIWQGGGPAIRIRNLSGAWSTAFARADIGSLDKSPSYRVLDDGSIVLAALDGTGDTRRVETSTWTATEGWRAVRLLSKPPGATTSQGVIPTSSGPFLYSVSGKELEFVAWVGACVGAAKDCEFRAISRRYVGGDWKDPVELKVGEKAGETRTGIDGTAVVALGPSTPLISRLNAARRSVDLRIRDDATDFKPQVTLPGSSPLFGESTELDGRFYSGGGALWTLMRRDNVPDGGTATTLSMAIGKVDPVAGSAKWVPAVSGSFEVRTFDGIFPYADGAGNFTVAANSATTGSSTAPIIAHSKNGESIEDVSVISSDESSASFVNVPRTAPRPGLDRAALFVVAARPSDSTTSGNRLRAYAYNGVGSGVARLLANETRLPRTFADGMLVFGCGGAILYAEDPADNSHTLQLVLVRESGS